MYFWKCWRDTRARFFLFLSVMLGGGATLAWAHMLEYNAKSGWALAPPSAPIDITRAWDETMVLLLIMGALLTAFAGLVLGASGLGEEFDRGTAAFLLTRPRARRYFVWSGGAAGALELLALSCVGVLAAFATLFFFTRTVGSWQLIKLVPLFFTTAMVTYGLACLMTLATRSSRDGLNYSMLMVVSYTLGAPMIRRFWQINLPSPLDMYTIFWNEKTALPLGTVAGWMLVALAFVVAQQFVLERAEL